MNNRLTLHDIAVILAEQTGKSEAEAELFLREFIRIVTDGVCTDRIVKVKGLGTFKLVTVEERESVSVNTGERYQIPAHYKFTFTPDKDLKELVNQPFSLFETTELNDEVEFPELERTESDETQEEKGEESEEEWMPDPILLPKEEVTDEKDEELTAEETLPTSVESQPVAEETIQKEEMADQEQESAAPAEVTPMELEKAEEESEKETSPSPEEKIVSVDEKEQCPEELDSPTQEAKNYAEEKINVREHHKRSSRRSGKTIAIILSLLVIVAFSGWLVFNQYRPSYTQTVVEEPVTVVGNDSVAQEATPVESVDSVEIEQEKPQEDPLADLDTITIKSGDRLTSISLHYYGHKFFWVYIYEYNQETIKDPNNVPIGTSLRIPHPARYEIDAKERTSLDKAVALQSEILSKH